MRPEHVLALQHPCKSQEDLQKIWDNPAIFNFSKKYKAWVTTCVAYDGGLEAEHLKWAACIRLANHTKQNFKSVALWTISERLRARSILIDQLAEVGSILGEEEFRTTNGLHFNKKLTAEEVGVVLKPHLLGN